MTGWEARWSGGGEGRKDGAGRGKVSCTSDAEKGRSQAETEERKAKTGQGAKMVSPWQTERAQFYSAISRSRRPTTLSLSCPLLLCTRL